MEPDDDGDFKNVQKDIEISDQKLYRVWRPDQSCKLSNIIEMKFKPLPKLKIRAQHSQVISAYSCKSRIRFLKETNYYKHAVADCAVSFNTKREFKKREITTIPEEGFQFIRYSKSISAFKEKKNHQEKVAALTVAVGRLKEMCLAKPEVLQDTVPEEVMKSFSRIEI